MPVAADHRLMKKFVVAFAAHLLASAWEDHLVGDPPIPIDGEQYACSQPNQLIRQIDHIYFGVESSASDLGAAIGELRAILKLSSPWPWGNYSNTMKGALAIGDVNVEFIKSERTTSAIALAPCEADDRSIQSQLLQRRLAVNVSGRQEKIPQNYTGFFLANVTGKTEVFLCRYHFDEALRRAVLLRKQLLIGGGPLGILAAVETHVDVGHQALRIWQQLLAPRRMPCSWNSTCHVDIGSGPAVVLKSVETLDSYSVRLRAVVWAVADVSKTRDVLRTHGLLGVLPNSARFQNCCALSLERLGVDIPVDLIFCSVDGKLAHQDRQWVV